MSASARLAPFRPVEAYGITIGFVLLSLLAWWRGGYWVRFVSIGCAVIGFGIALDVLHRPGPLPELDAQNGETVLLTGCVVDPPVLGRDRERFLLELGPRAIASVSMMAKPDAPPLNYGQRVEIEAKIRLPHNYHNPGAFDYAAYLSRQNIFWYASMPRDGAVRIMPGRCGSRLAGVVFGLRTAALDRIERLYAGNDYATAMMEAILIGQSAKLEKVWTDHFRRTGTYHALVISGLHVTVLAGVLLFLLRMCMTGELTALLIACAAAWVYAAVSGWSAPVNRAAGGFTLVPDRPVLLPARARPQPPGRDRIPVRVFRPGPTVRPELSVVLPFGGRARRGCGTDPRTNVRAVHASHPVHPRSQLRPAYSA